MIRILFRFLSPYQRGCGRTMMPVGYIQRRYSSKNLCDLTDVLLFVNHPKRMTKTIYRSYKIVFRLCCRIFPDDFIQILIFRISKEYRFYIRITYTDMLHAVFLFIATGKFMLLDDPFHIIRDISTYHQSKLCFAMHCLRIDIITRFRILYQPAFFLKFPEVFGGFLIYFRGMLIRPGRKINFRPDNMIQRLFIPCSLHPRLL